MQNTVTTDPGNLMDLDKGQVNRRIFIELSDGYGPGAVQ